MLHSSDMMLTKMLPTRLKILTARLHMPEWDEKIRYYGFYILDVKKDRVIS